jgi:predicted glycosyl hydrolase (DUF1957 family)
MRRCALFAKGTGTGTPRPSALERSLHRQPTPRVDVAFPPGHRVVERPGSWCSRGRHARWLATKRLGRALAQRRALERQARVLAGEQGWQDGALELEQALVELLLGLSELREVLLFPAHEFV